MMENPFLNTVLPELLDAAEPDYQKIRSVIIRAYCIATGENLDETGGPSDPKLAPVVRWLNRLQIEAGVSFFRKKSVLVSVFFPDLSSKASLVGQLSCQICHGGFPVCTIPIRIKPTSYQSVKAKTKRAFKRAIAEGLKTSHNFGGRKLCIQILFVLRFQNTSSDLDNLAKLVLDGAKGTLYADDNQVDHLGLLRIQCREDEEEFVSINVRETKLNEHADVLFHRMQHGWGVKELRLEDFMDEQTTGSK